MNTLETIPYLINAILAICLTVGGFFAYRNGRQSQLNKFQQDTNNALKQRVEVLESKIVDFEKENVIQRHIIETITAALKQRGIFISIDGDIVTIQDKSGVSSHKKVITTTSVKLVQDEEES